MAEQKEKTEVVPPTSQKDLEERLKADFSTSAVDSPIDEDGKVKEDNVAFEGDGNDTSAYIGVDPIYQNYANDTEKPYAFEGVEGDSVEQMLGDNFAVGQDVPVESENTLGGGSNYESVYTHVSGSDVTPEVVDRAEVQKENEEAQKAAVEGTTTETSSGTTAAKPAAATTTKKTSSPSSS